MKKHKKKEVSICFQKPTFVVANPVLQDSATAPVVGVFTREDCSDIVLSLQKVFISQLVTTLSVQDP